MSEIKELPHVPDAVGIFQFDARKKTLLVPISAIEGLAGTWAAFASSNDVQILPYHNPVVKLTCNEDWEELCKRLHYVIAYFIHANDLSTSEAEEEICFAMEQFAKKNGLPEHPWDDDYEDLYAEKDETRQD